MDEPKIKKTRNQEAAEPDMDRLSSVPDCILIHILSFLDTGSAIKTSVLSKRFRLLWTSLPCLDFKLCGCSLNRFSSFVNNVLARREPSNLRMFRLSLGKGVDSALLDNCIAYAAQHKVEHLRIRAYTNDSSLTLPRLLLTSSWLTNLRLNNVTQSSIMLPKSLELPILKVLRLKNFVFSDKNYTGEIFSGCPSLETLILNKCWFRPSEKVKVLDVNCLKLKNLEIRHWRSPWRCFDEHMINVNAPKLCSFKFQGHIVKINFMEDSPFLDEVCFDLYYPTACALVDVNERRQRTSECFISMLGQLCNMKCLVLSLNMVEVLSAIPYLQEHGHSTFENLRHIKFTADDKHIELRIPINSVVPLLKCCASNMLVLDVSEEQKIFVNVKCSKMKIMCKDATMTIPVHIMSYLIECSPSAELLIVE